MSEEKRIPRQTYTISGFPMPHEDAVWLWEHCRPFAQYPYEFEEDIDGN